MQRFLSISLALLMLALSLKMTVAVHYCDKEIANASIGFGDRGDVGCGMESIDYCTYPVVNKASCCSDHISQVSVDYEYSHVPEMSLGADFLAVLPKFQLYGLSKVSVYTNEFFYRPPPDVTAVLLPFIQVFII